MQKKKPSFQVIPNYRINFIPSWNESKEVPAQQGLQGCGPPSFPDPAGSTFTVNWSQTIAAISRSEPNLRNPHATMVQRKSGWSRNYGSPVH
jgi:hypothetical protein